MGQSFTKSVVRLFKPREVRVLVSGLDAAGKTQMLYKLKLGECITTIPTIGFNVETIPYKNLAFTVWDVSGRDKLRPLLRHYYQGTDICILVVDSNNRERLHESHEILGDWMNGDELQEAVFVGMANKQDLKNAMFASEMETMMNKGLPRHVKFFPTTATTGEGLYECLDWLVDEMNGKHTLDIVSEPWKEVAKDMKEDGKAGYKIVSSTLKTLLYTFDLNSKV
ncbi:uncharacterized protein LOC135495152 [Lineus longissimus]|uniref:uncharacterized protein LOC135495152 n=1 Tax=Lineus longissimus TaxID=88925 RepID=UPI002B4F3BE2